LQPYRHIIHEPDAIARREPLRPCRHRPEHVGQRLNLSLGKIAEHIARHPVLVPRMADAEPDPTEVSADMGDCGADAVVPRCSAAGFDFDAEGIEVQLVVKASHRALIKLEEIHRGADASPALIHEGGGLEQDNFLGPDPAFARPALKALLPNIKAVELLEGVHGHEADIVPVHRVSVAGIAEASPDLHPDRRGLSPLSLGSG
jgi:hypothetical protein